MVSEQVVLLLFRSCLLAYLIGAALALAFTRQQRLANTFGFLGSCLGGLAGMAASWLCLQDGASPAFDLLPLTTPLFPFAVKLDPLGAFFVLLISLSAVAISIYSIGYAAHYYGVKNVGALAAFFNLLLLANTLVFCASHAVFFLVVWEVMALAAFVLVSFEHEEPKTRQAGMLFFVMSHIGTGCLVLGYLLLNRAGGSFRFEDFHLLGTQLSPLERHAAFFLFLVGFGVKAGIIPLHVWLPEAHPVAPSNVSALMSGVLLKSGIYGLLRVLLDFLGNPPAWWGITLLVLGSALCLAGCALRARAERPEAPAGFQQPGEHRHHSDGNRRLADAQLFRSAGPGCLGACGGALSHPQSCLLQRAAVFGRRRSIERGSHQGPRKAGWTDPRDAEDGFLSFSWVPLRFAASRL